MTLKEVFNVPGLIDGQTTITITDGHVTSRGCWKDASVLGAVSAVGNCRITNLHYNRERNALVIKVEAAKVEASKT